MSKKMKCFIVLVIILSFTAGAVANADGGLKRLAEVYLNDSISVVINGTVFSAKDPQDGSAYVPITYKGRTYLPLRAVAEAVGLPVEYDVNTKTAYLGTKPNTTNGPVPEVYVNATPEYTGLPKRYVTKDIDAARLTTAAGKTFEFGYCGEYSRFMKPTFKCDFKFKKLKFTIYSAWSQEELDKGYAKADDTLRLEITNELGVVIKSIRDIKQGTETEFDIDCIDYKNLTVYCTGGGTIIGEPKFVK